MSQDTDAFQCCTLVRQSCCTTPHIDFSAFGLSTGRCLGPPIRLPTPFDIKRFIGYQALTGSVITSGMCRLAYHLKTTHRTLWTLGYKVRLNAPGDRYRIPNKSEAQRGNTNTFRSISRNIHIPFSSHTMSYIRRTSFVSHVLCPSDLNVYGLGGRQDYRLILGNERIAGEALSGVKEQTPAQCRLHHAAWMRHLRGPSGPSSRTQLRTGSGGVGTALLR